MGVLNTQAECRGGDFMRRRHIQLLILLVVVSIVALVSAPSARAVQRQTPESEHGAAPAAQLGVVSAPAPVQGHAPEPSHPAPAPKAEHPAAPQAAPGHSPAPVGQEGHGAEAKGEHAAEHGAEHGADHGPPLPTISPIAGVTFVDTMINLMENELHGRVLGWRPNDIIVGRFTDNINNYQLGVLEAIRFTTLRLKDSLTRMGDADTYDPDLEYALNLFMIRATSFWFPTAEGEYDKAIEHLRNFRAKLEKGQRTFYYRKDNLISLLSVYKDLLGNVNKTLVVSPISWFQADDSFYYAKGVAHVCYEILRVVRVGYQKQLASTMYGIEMMDTIMHELYRVENIDPWLVLDSDLGSILANHRANINAPLSEATHLMGILALL